MSETTNYQDRIERGLRSETALRSETPEVHTLADRMAYHETPGVSVAVIDGGRLAWAKGYGICEAGRPEPITTQTLFQAGSISKPVTAVAVLKLVEDGVLDLDEDVNQYLKSWQVPPVGDWQPRVTLRQLLNHTAGLTVHGFPGYLTTWPIPTVVQVLNGEPPANTAPVRVNTVPGTQMRYSGGGTTIVQLLLTDLLGKSFPELMRELVLDPLGMVHSSYEQPLPPDRAKFAATGHPDDSQPIVGKWHLYPEMAAAGLWTTPSDLALFALDIQQTLAGQPGKILSQAMVQQMLTPQVEDHIGLGLFLSGKGETSRFGHGGSDAGFICSLTAYKQGGQGSIVMLNCNRGWRVLVEMEQAIAREYGWPDYAPPGEPPIVTLEASVLESYTGTYALTPQFTFQVSYRDEGLMLEPTGQVPFPLYAESETKFFARVVAAEITFQRSESGEVTGLVFKQNGREMTAPRQA